MMNFALWDGHTSVAGLAVSSTTQLPPLPDGSECVPLVGDHSAFTVSLVDGVVTEVPIEVPIEVLRSQLWEKALAYRDSRMAAGCMTPAGPVDTDLTSQQKITSVGATALASKVMGGSFTVSWTMQDNSVVPLDADGMLAMGLAVTYYVSACQYAGTAIRDQIDTAHDAAALAAIDITAGYPAN